MVKIVQPIDLRRKLAKAAWPMDPRRRLEELRSAEEKSRSLWVGALLLDVSDPKRKELFFEWQKDQQELQRFESNDLLRQAGELGIEIPPTSDWWYESKIEDSQEGSTATGRKPVIERWLTPKGQLMVAKLVREERRKNLEWWVRIITPVLSLIIGLLGLIVAVITILR